MVLDIYTNLHSGRLCYTRSELGSLRHACSRISSSTTMHEARLYTRTELLGLNNHLVQRNKVPAAVFSLTEALGTAGRARKTHRSRYQGWQARTKANLRAVNKLDPVQSRRDVDPLTDVNHKKLISIDCHRHQSGSSDGISMCLLNVRSVRNKPSLISDFIPDNNLDVLALTETWLQKDDVAQSYEVSEMMSAG